MDRLLRFLEVQKLFYSICIKLYFQFVHVGFSDRISASHDNVNNGICLRDVLHYGKLIFSRQLQSVYTLYYNL